MRVFGMEGEAFREVCLYSTLLPVRSSTLGVALRVIAHSVTKG